MMKNINRIMKNGDIDQYTKIDNTLMNINDINSSYHLATFAHHNLNDTTTISHFKRVLKDLT